MSLLFGAATSDRVLCGSNAVLDNLFSSANGLTVSFWFYTTNVAGNSGKVFIDKLNDLTQFFASGTTGNLKLRVERTVASDLTTNDTPLSAVNTWKFVAFVWNSNSTPSGHIYHGGLNTVVAESTYGTNSDGSGTVTADATDNWVIGNKGKTAWNKSVVGRMAVCQVYNRVLALGELQAQQFNPHVVSGCVAFWHLGYNGTSTQPDWSGNANAGTVTGASVAAHVPLRPPFGAWAGWRGAKGVPTSRMPDLQMRAYQALLAQ